MKNAFKFFSIILMLLTTLLMTSCEKKTETSVMSEQPQLSCREYGYQQLCKGLETQFEETPSPVPWANVYSYTDNYLDFYGVNEVIEGDTYYVINRGYVYQMAKNGNNVEASGELFRPSSIWGVTPTGQCYAVWYADA